MVNKDSCEGCDRRASEANRRPRDRFLAARPSPSVAGLMLPSSTASPSQRSHCCLCHPLPLYARANATHYRTVHMRGPEGPELGLAGVLGRLPVCLGLDLNLRPFQPEARSEDRDRLSPPPLRPSWQPPLRGESSPGRASGWGPGRRLPPGIARRVAG